MRGASSTLIIHWFRAESSCAERWCATAESWRGGSTREAFRAFRSGSAKARNPPKSTDQLQHWEHIAPQIGDFLPIFAAGCDLRPQRLKDPRAADILGPRPVLGGSPVQATGLADRVGFRTRLLSQRGNVCHRDAPASQLGGRESLARELPASPAFPKHVHNQRFRGGAAGNSPKLVIRRHLLTWPR